MYKTTEMVPVLLLGLASAPLIIFSPWRVSEQLQNLNATFQNKWPSETPKYCNKKGIKSVLPKPVWLNNSSFYFSFFCCKLPPKLCNLKPCAPIEPLCNTQSNARDSTNHFGMCFCSKIFFWEMQYCLPSQVPGLVKIPRELWISCSVKGWTLVESGVQDLWIPWDCLGTAHL